MTLRSTALILASAAFTAGAAIASPTIGQPAPTFVATDSNGKAVRLADYKGKTVILEWTNSGCPFVQKHYGSGNMQKTQGAARDAGVVWLTVNSGAPGKQGHFSGAQANAYVAGQKAKPSAYLIDSRGVIGRGYDAKTTPQIAIVDPAGTLVYQGGIDDKPTADPADIAGARNHVLAALDEMKAGKPISVAETRPYGCAVKYGG